MRDLPDLLPASQAPEKNAQSLNAQYERAGFDICASAPGTLFCYSTRPLKPQERQLGYALRHQELRHGEKARNWLDLHNVDYKFHDFREDGLEPDRVAAWLQELGWESLLNRRSTSWKSLDQSTRENMNDDTALDAILAQPTLIKRPLLDIGHERHIGFSADRYSAIFNKHTL